MGTRAEDLTPGLPVDGDEFVRGSTGNQWALSTWAGIKSQLETDGFSKTGIYFDYLWVPAGAGIPRTTNGAEANTSELATNDVMLDTLDFDTTTEEGAGWWVTFPIGWNAGTILCRPYWTAASGSGTVKWDFSGYAFANSDAIDVAMGTEQSSTDTLITANDMHIGPTTAAMTIGGTPADGEPVYLQVARDVATDTLGVDASLIGFIVEFRRTAQTATAL